MKICKRCCESREDELFRVRKNRGKLYKLAVCLICERKQKNECEHKRYKKMSKDQKNAIFERSSVNSKKESYKIWHRKYQKDKEENDVAYKLKRRIGALLRYNLHKKGNSTFDILGYSAADLRKHLESMFKPWMNWENWGVYNSKLWDDSNPNTWTWQVDHIVPVISFNVKEIGDEEFNRCWSLSNLRPLSAKANILKGAK